MNDSLMFAKRIAAACPSAKFVGFTGGKVPYTKVGVGAGKLTPDDHLISASELDAGPPMGAEYFGLFMQRPTRAPNGKVAYTLDLDNKGGGAMHPAMDRLLSVAHAMGLLVERSISGTGAHLVFLADDDPTLPKSIRLGDRQFIEIFGHSTGSGKSVLLSGIGARGEMVEINSVRGLLNAAGIGVDVVNQADPQRGDIRPSNSTSSGFDSSMFAERVQQLGRKLRSGDGRYDMLVKFVGWLSAKGVRGEAAVQAVNEVVTTFYEPEDLNWQRDILPMVKRLNDQDDRQDAAVLEQAVSLFEPVPEVLQKEADLALLAQRDHAPMRPVVYAPGGDIVPEKHPPQVVRHFMRAGLTVIAGASGAGKTTALLGLAAHVSGLAVNQTMSPTRLRRKVIYITEDHEQAAATLRTIRRRMGTAERESEWQSWLTVMPAVRLTKEQVAQVVKDLRIAYTYVNQWGTTVEPLIVFDTASACLAIENENDNAEVASFIEAIKVAMGAASVWLIGHLTKAQVVGRADLEGAFRGAGAWAANAHGTAVFFRDEKAGVGVLAVQKTRMQVEFTEVHFKFATEEHMIMNEDEGEVELLRVGYCTFAPGDREVRNQAAENKVVEATEQVIQAAKTVLEGLETLDEGQRYISPTSLVEKAYRLATGKELAKGRRTSALIESLAQSPLFRVIDVTKTERTVHGLPRQMQSRIVLRSCLQLPSDMPAVSERFLPDFFS